MIEPDGNPSTYKRRWLETQSTSEEIRFGHENGDINRVSMRGSEVRQQTQI